MDSETRSYRTGDREAVLDLTSDCRDFASGRGDGLLHVFVPHATAGIAIIETGAGSDDDLLTALADLLPADDRWQHRHGSRGHGRSHVMPALVPPYATVPGAGRTPRPRHLAEHLSGRPQRRQRRARGAPQLPGGLTWRSRPAVASDTASILEVVEAAFGDHGVQVARMVAALDASHSTRASLVAVVDGAVVGHVQLSRSWVDARQKLVDVLVLSPLSVAQDHQGAGIGTALLDAAVAEAERLGAPAVFLEGDPGYYGPRGWAAATPLGFTRPSVRVPEPAFQVVVLPAHQAWMTGALVYCEPFWALDCVGLRDPRLADVEARSGISGG